MLMYNFNFVETEQKILERRQWVKVYSFLEDMIRNAAINQQIVQSSEPAKLCIENAKWNVQNV